MSDGSDADFIEDHMGNQEKDKASFVQLANEKEFEICRFFISWGIGGIALVVGFYLHNFNINSPVVPYLPLLRRSLMPLGLSVAVGILHYYSYRHRLLRKAEQLDRSNRGYLSRVMEKVFQSCQR